MFVPAVTVLSAALQYVVAHSAYTVLSHYRSLPPTLAERRKLCVS